jgi:hypothetical protein
MATKCPKCPGEMIAGYSPDHASDGWIKPGTWYEGVPKKNFFGNIKLKGEPFVIAIYRCSACGFLESYAQPK